MNDNPPKSLWGPWSPVVTDETERIAQLRCIRTLVHVLLNSRKALDYTDTVSVLLCSLREAELHLPSTEGLTIAEWAPLHEEATRRAHKAFWDARLLFDALPAVRQRDIIATFAVLHKPLTPPKEG